MLTIRTELKVVCTNPDQRECRDRRADDEVHQDPVRDLVLTTEHSKRRPDVRELIRNRLVVFR